MAYLLKILFIFKQLAIATFYHFRGIKESQAILTSQPIDLDQLNF